MSPTEVWNPIGTLAGWTCGTCGMWVQGYHDCLPARSVSPWDPSLAISLQRIAVALEAIAERLTKETK